jgi:hypothetical protein|tara:strand:+ start:9305 stop:9715 length:411 start_codon:yes stop_codon:yes gene_type:complete
MMAKAKMGASHGWTGNYVESATASFSLVPGDAGKTFILKDAAVTVTLPALTDVEAGYSITLISGDDSEHILTGGASKIYGHAIDGSGSAAETVLPLTGHSTITPGAGMIIGSKYDITTDGTNWYVYVIAGAEVAGS